MNSTASMHPTMPSVQNQFVCQKENSGHANEIFNAPLVDLEGFLKGDIEATNHAAQQIRVACINYGFFQVINHGVDSKLISIAHDLANAFFKVPSHVKERAQKKPGSMWGYCVAHEYGPFGSKVSWKETLSFGFHQYASGELVVKDFFDVALGKDFELTGSIYQKYCESMEELSFSLLEILGISLGTDPSYFKEFFKDSSSIMRCNYYPPCKEPGALGTAPHCDPTSLTLLHQDQVGGLEVFVDNKWKSVQPRSDALVINIGDTFTALSNGIYKSSLHRAVLNKNNERMSLAFFLCPKEDKVVRPPHDLGVVRKYPDFRWFDLLQFTQTQRKSDANTLHNFTSWFEFSKKDY